MLNSQTHKINTNQGYLAGSDAIRDLGVMTSSLTLDVETTKKKPKPNLKKKKTLINKLIYNVRLNKIICKCLHSIFQNISKKHMQ